MKMPQKFEDSKLVINNPKSNNNERNTLVIQNPHYLSGDNIPESMRFRNLELTREHCVDMSLLTSYFRFLRHYSDDTLQSRLNDSEKPDISSKLRRCENYTAKLFENWEIRRNIITFCSKEAETLKKELDLTFEQDNAKAVTAAKIDSYALRDLQNEKNRYYANYNKITQWVRQQEGVESILQDRANDVLRNNCDENRNYLTDFKLFYKDHVN
ncbi:hypothetical protein ACO0QE_004187 [Hanseniaspora vineae]